MTSSNILLVSTIISCSLISSVSSSWGDQSSFYQLCVEYCQKNTCANTESFTEWSEKQWTVDRLVGITCSDDCRYTCMWETCHEMMHNRYGIVPQFHGKWPFIRVLGMQEPASVVFSLMNLLTNLYMIIWFRRHVSSSAPMFQVWTGYGVTALIAWTCSTIFHYRDTPVTEMMDYFTAFLTVLTSLLACVLRMLGTQNTGSVMVVTAAFLAFYSNHVYNMAFIRFDYGYNMKVNVGVGVLNGVMWLVWSLLHYSDGPHVKRGVIAIIMLSLSLSLELLDFAPLMWTLDSHSLWHLATVPIPLLWFRFAAGDCNTQEKQIKSKKQQ